ncbi:DUF1349 domain-containing protein [Sphingomonas montana]|uniref:DUF1349 domain-containing protein n=1 Tax=Sphingomonas montana TaxID=1843236 RepID=UPI00096E73A1|nr:DUF1349 domain-containing protein [Sphingomonas montana]
MRMLLPVAAFAAFAVASPAQAQELGDRPVRITLPGIGFTRSLNGAADNAVSSGGALTLRSDAKRDNFRDPDGKLSNNTAPVLLAGVDNRRPFTLTARLTPQFNATYDAGTLYVWVRDDLWLKLAMERDERGKTRIVSVRTDGTSDDNNHDVVTAKSVMMKISSDTKTVGLYYSIDGRSWQLVRLFKNGYPDKIWLGISTQSPLGKGTTTKFEALSLTQKSIADFRLGQ